MRVRPSKNYMLSLLILCAVWALVHIGNDLLLDFEDRNPSISTGRSTSGSIRNAKRMPTDGANFQTYSRIGSLIGRTHVHDTLRLVIYQTYATIHKEQPDLKFVYGEGCWPMAGNRWLGQGHQNGLAFDFLVPVRRDGVSTPLPKTVMDGFGYNLDFNEDGKMGKYQIDFEAMAFHLRTLEQVAVANGLIIRAIHYEPSLLPNLWQSDRLKSLKKKFNTEPLVGRQDEHYHVEFAKKMTAPVVRKNPKATRPDSKKAKKKRRKARSNK
jgi:penicillin-insensitive murein DD-endopeptidase